MQSARACGGLTARASSLVSGTPVKRASSSAFLAGQRPLLRGRCRHVHRSRPVTCLWEDRGPKQRMQASTSSRSQGWNGASGSAGGSQVLTPDEVSERLKKFNVLVEEVLKTAVATGPSGLLRFTQGVEAVAYVGREWLQRAAPSRQGSEKQPLGAPALLRLLFERLGATYIKLGQFIASSPTLFPSEYVNEFQSCLDATPPVPFAEIKATVQESLGRKLEDVYDFFDPTPIAAASVAQVHAARLKGTGREVVVKVLKGGVEEVLKADLNFLYITARVLEFLNPELARSTSMVGIISDIRTSMLEETDFTKEAANISAFRAYVDSVDLSSRATAPEVFPFASSSKVLTMERFYGVPLTDLNAIRLVSPDPEATLITALNVWFGSVLACETFHADLHAGNLLVLKDGRVGFIDFGIVGRISPPTWTAIQAFMASVGTAGQYPAMAAALAQMGATNEEVDLVSFAEDLRVLFAKVEEVQPEVVVAAGAGPSGGGVAGAQLTIDERQINALVLDVIKVSEKYGLRFPREFGLFLKQLLYFDRYTRLLAPNLRVLKDDRIRIRPGQGMPPGGMRPTEVHEKVVPLYANSGIHRGPSPLT